MKVNAANRAPVKSAVSRFMGTRGSEEGADKLCVTHLCSPHAQRPPHQQLRSNALVVINGPTPGLSANLTLGLLSDAPSSDHNRKDSRAVQRLCALAAFVIRCWELNSHEWERAARITSMKPNRPRRQLAVTTPPINAPMMPSKATSLPVRYKFRTGVRGPSQVLRYFSGVAG
jgi:hypothetical protein